MLPRVPLPPADIADESPQFFCLDDLRIQTNEVVPSRDAKGKKESLESSRRIYKAIADVDSISLGEYLIELCDGKIAATKHVLLSFNFKSSATRHKRIEEGWKQLQLESGAAHMGVD